MMKIKHWRKRTPTLIQMEAVECGAACLGIILGYWGRYVPLEQLRLDAGVSRHGSNALNMIKAARSYGLEAKGFRKSLEELYEIDAPAVILWELNHFVVIEGFGKKEVYLNDPAVGPRAVTYQELDESYSGLVFTFKPTETFEKGGKPLSLVKELYGRLKKTSGSLYYLLLAGLCLVIPGLALPAFARIFVDQVLVMHVFEWKWLFLSALLLVTLIGGALTWLRAYFLNRLNGRLSILFSSEFLWHLLRLPIAFYTQRFPGEIAYRSTLNNKVAKKMTGALATTIIDMIVVIFYGLVMLKYDLLIGIVGFLAAVLNLVIFLWIQRSRIDAYARFQQEQGKWIGNSIGALQQMETIKAIGIESETFARYAGYYTKNLNALQEISKKDAILGTAPILFQALSIAALLTIGSLRVMEGTLSFGMLIALQTLMISFLTPVSRFVNFGQKMQNIKSEIARLNDVLKNKVDPIYEARSSRRAEKSSLKLEGYLEFRKVTFGYSRLAPPLIENLSFTIKPGERLALVGPSGCGKSTIAKLACGLFLPWEGEILYDGKPLEEIPEDLFYHSLGHVDQEIFLFSGTIRENITLWNDIVTEEMVVQAAEASAIHEEIMLRKNGYENILNEGGRNLSGGQRQRLEIARSLLYSPSLLVMDEATSALDSETEKYISDRIRQSGCSVVMIAHRLSTIQDCDEILVLERGKVVQRGSHPKLKNERGLYRQLIESENG
ncbi:MAG: NHLP family bacteriocin export ABC transporter peptidase/permease/ATPase subunit [Chlamydiales bacterium]|nr:NHLP family bacteriocin export ABC transporter peptidase/permease/ATPase subunit [Chlamydiales bacterium]